MRSRFEGCFLGLAVGDALGEPWEFHLRTAIEPYDIMSTYRGRVTDDTMMTIAIAKALIEGQGYRRDKVVEQFIKWLDDTGKSPGIGCLSACRRLARGEFKPSKSGGNGTAMRVSPIGLFYHNDLDALEKFARDSSILTHNHWAATGGAITVARAIAYLVEKKTFDKSDFIETLANFLDEGEFKEFPGYILELEDYLEMESRDALIELGIKGVNSPYLEQLTNPAVAGKGVVSGYTIPTVLAALYAFLITPGDLVNSISEAVLAGGDADTTAAICGSISGAFNGADAIPSNLLVNLRKKEELISLASQLFELKHGS
ncbi:MAG: ADP-ribosylglycohydrolase family protein [Candidatus Hodarchaeota archaeon]